LLEFVAEFLAIDGAEVFDFEQIVLGGIDPALFVMCEDATGDNGMQMNMLRQCLPPGVETTVMPSVPFQRLSAKLCSVSVAA